MWSTILGKDGLAHPDARRAAEQYASLAARRFGDRLVGVYLFGSGAMGGFDVRRSDVDLLVVLDGRADTDCRDIRRVQAASGLHSTARALRQGRFTGAGTCNAAYVPHDQLNRPVTAIDPTGSHVGHELVRGGAFDVNPVQWRTLLDHGVAVLGPPPVELGLDPEPEELVRWNHQNLHDYWLPLARRVQQGRKPLPFHSLRTGLHWSVLGPLRLHATIATGEVLSKRAAGDHGLATMDPRWHSLIRAAQLALDGHNVRGQFPDKRDLLRQIGDFGVAVVDSADARLAGPPNAVG
jgi:hypothetical protein